MDARSRFAFLALILAQAVHSIEEYAFGLYEVFAPARFVSGLASDDPRTGFAIFNGALILLGVWCYVARVRPGHPSARAWAWPWVVVELANGIGHPALAIARGGYFHGVVTAPALFALALYLGARLVRNAGGVQRP